MSDTKNTPGSGWTATRVAWLVVLLSLAVIAALPTWQNVFDLATRSAEYSHMMLVVPVALLLLWQRRERLAGVPLAATATGALVALLGVAMDFVGFATQVDIVKDTGMVVMLLGAIVTVTGWAWVVRAAPALAALAFLIPVPGRVRQRIALPLQEASATITEHIMDFFGVPIARLGNVLQINGVDVAVAEACNGMRMVVALGLVAYAFAFSMPLRPWARVVILASSPLVALLANVLRLGPNVLFYGYTSEETAKFAHDVSGWLVLLVALGVLWGSVALARWLELPIEPARPNAR
ncbi:MAG: exosortase/archaeosortase family protein [Phycisphaeraceae bacterium]|nr:exosortase/archaeosortase family protein [Phycisphaeraceae bacterium]